MLKYMLFTLLLIIGSLNATAASIAKITACDPCGTVGREHAAKSVFNWNQSGEVYVADFYMREGFKYNVYIDYVVEGPDRFPIHKTNLIPLNPAEQEAFNDIFALYDSLKSAIQNNRSLNNKVAPSLLLKNAAPFELGTVKIIHPAITVHDFLSNSQMRNNMYESHIALGVYDIAAITNRITDTLSLGALHLKDLKLGYRIEFPDGSSILVYPNLSSRTLDIAENTARDADNNTVPTNRNMITGSYQFSNPESYQSMRQYLEAMFGVSVFNNMTCTSYIMICSFSGTTLTCTVPRCAY